MQSTVLTESFSEPEFNISEVIRYCRAEAEEELLEIINECMSECRDKLSYRVCYAEFDIDFKNGEIVFSFMTTDSTDLIKNLSGARSAVVFGASIGMEIDRLIIKYGRISPLKALVFQAIGAERIESLCDVFCEKLGEKYKKNGLYLKPRFSAGYGDFSLEYQKDIFRVLDCPRKIGLTLNESLVMSPSKSVTAIIGISEFKDGCQDSACEGCGKADCEFRKGAF